jgi:aminocarboxymuconate-semialdehyde decarboxylase
MTTVDVHVHVIPKPVVASLRNGSAPLPARVVTETDGRTVVAHDEGYRYPLDAAFYDIGALQAALAARGISHAVVSPAPPMFGYRLSRDDAVRWCIHLNDAVAELVGKDPEHLRGLAVLPLAHPADAVWELTRCINQLGLAGAIVGPHVEGVPLDDAALHPVLSTANQLGAVLFVHPYYTGPKPGLDAWYLTNLIGNPLETCVCAARLCFSGALSEFVDLRVLLAHGGGYLPYQVGRLDHGQRVRAELTGLERPGELLRRFHYDTLTHLPSATEWLINLVGSDRVALGTDLPFDMGGPGLSEQLRGLRLEESARRRVAFETAADLFGFTEGKQTRV